MAKTVHAVLAFGLEERVTLLWGFVLRGLAVLGEIGFVVGAEVRFRWQQRQASLLHFDCFARIASFEVSKRQQAEGLELSTFG